MEYLIVGAGPAGLQLAYFLEQAGRDYLVLESGLTPGTFFRTFPRHQRLISINKRHTGSDYREFYLRMDWNSLLSEDRALRFTRYSERYFPSPDELVRYLGDFAAACRLKIQYRTRIVKVSKNGGFIVTDENGHSYGAKRLIVATGVSQPHVPPIPGIETAELYGSVSVNPRDFLNQRVLILGKGNSAFETANNLLDTYQLKSQNALLDGTVERIERCNGSYNVTVRFSRANEVKRNLAYDRVIVCTGFRFDPSIFAEDCRPELVISDRFPAQTSEWESTNVKDLYFAGTLMQVRDFKKSTGGFIHGFRYGIRALHRMLEQKYHSIPWPHRDLPAHAQTLMEAVIERVNRTSGLWQQFGFLCDLIVPSEDQRARYYQELPIDYVRESEFGSAERYFTISLEYGPDHDKLDPFDIAIGRIAQDDPERSHQGRYLL